MRPPTPLADRLSRALRLGDDALRRLLPGTPASRRDGLLALLTIHVLHTAPIERLGAAVQWQHHPTVATLKGALEADLIADLERDDDAAGWDLPDDPVAALRMIARTDLVPDVYTWAAELASASELVEFLTLEGGPDGGFDDLVACCQIGLGGEAKVELARNYWDEMGNGSVEDVHTELHRRLVQALGIAGIPRQQQRTEALVRGALGGLLATNRWLQPEMIGALGLIELQAGPRCRQVVTGLRRLELPADALPFYLEHAEVDPRHGRDWLTKAVAPLVDANPDWGPGIVRGARWRSLVNARFFEAMSAQFDVGGVAAAGLAAAS
jgi:hypothetical protein